MAERPPTPSESQQKAEQERRAKYAERPDGGFGPMGSGGLTNSSGRSSYSGRNNPAQWTVSPDEYKEEYRSLAQFTSGREFRPEEVSDGGPQYLVEADDIYDEEYGESRLVAPPVLGETPQGYRDF